MWCAGNNSEVCGRSNWLSVYHKYLEEEPTDPPTSGKPSLIGCHNDTGLVTGAPRALDGP